MVKIAGGDALKLTRLKEIQAWFASPEELWKEAMTVSRDIRARQSRRGCSTTGVYF